MKNHARRAVRFGTLAFPFIGSISYKTYKWIDVKYGKGSLLYVLDTR